MGIRIKADAKDVLYGKFRNTLKYINGYEQEARADVKDNRDYSPAAVLSRIQRIREEFEAELALLAKGMNVRFDKDVTIKGHPDSPL